MSHCVCPSWMGTVLLCPFRRLVNNPDKILAPYVVDGMTVLEVGPGMGFFSLPIARRVGPTGKVICVELQEKMLEGLRQRAIRAGLAGRIETRGCTVDTLGIGDLAGRIEFVLLFYVAHEVPDVARLLAEIAAAMKPGGRCLVVEPRFHVTATEFDRTISAATSCGLRIAGRPSMVFSRAALVMKPDNA